MTEFYQLPARLLRPGMSTADGQDITDVEPAGDLVLYHTYTPRPDDGDEDENNYSAPDGRVSARDELIDLAVFPDTEVDGRITEKEPRRKEAGHESQPDPHPHAGAERRTRDDRNRDHRRSH